MNAVFLFVALLVVVLISVLVLYVRRYCSMTNEKEVYRVAFKMEDQPVASTIPTTPQMPQLIDTNDLVIRYSDVETEEEV